MFILYNNEISEWIKDKERCGQRFHESTEELFGDNCQDCGSVICFSDYSTVEVSGSDRETNQRKLNENLEKVSEFLSINK